MLILAPTYAAGDSNECLDCHEGSLDEPFNKSWHVFRSASKGADGAAQCTGCHGESESHLNGPDGNAPDVVFGPDKDSPVEAQNAACLSCHDGGKQTWWIGSIHDDEDVTCNSCHAVHVSTNQAATPEQQSAICYDCHTEVRAAAQLRSRHPIEEGRTTCVDCHNPHGSSTEAMLAEPTLNDACYSCHAEKRGPFLFEHEPATEDCSICHDPHGSINDALLSSRTPFLCQQCHSAAFHPSQLMSGSGLPSESANPYLLGKDCMNCHAQVHGSNHPSGARMTR